MTVLFAGTYNSRDTGGIPLAGGGQTQAGVLLRSDALVALTDVGLGELDVSPIGTIVDFRTATERSEAPDRLPPRPLDTVHLSVLEGAMTGMAASPQVSSDAVKAAMAQVPTLADLYVGMLRHGAASFARVARLVARPTDGVKRAVLVHCTAGKDRTGVAAAVLLDAVGAQRDAVIADYTLSQQNLAGEWAERMLHYIASRGVSVGPQVEQLVTATPPEAMQAALGWLDDQGGSVAYLRAAGIGDDELALLRARLGG